MSTRGGNASFQMAKILWASIRLRRMGVFPVYSQQQVMRTIVITRNTGLTAVLG
ncbi:hypothetical protein SERLADRAFT_476502, partial [Serpula lacrymans var. lacrymans S7.9]